MSIRLQAKSVVITYDESGMVIEKIQQQDGDNTVIVLDVDAAIEFISLIMMAQAAVSQGLAMGMPREMVFRPDDNLCT